MRRLFLNSRTKAVFAEEKRAEARPPQTLSKGLRTSGAPCAFTALDRNGKRPLPMPKGKKTHLKTDHSVSRWYNGKYF